jgi:polyisoprenoid-binding protein YceI
MNGALRAALVLGLAAASPAAPAADWKMDAGQSRLGFVASYDRVPFETRFERFTANLRFDAAQPAEGRIEIAIEMTSVNSRSPDRDEGMRAPEWFHTARFPTARFVSRRILPSGDGTFRVGGDLTIKGITRAVEIPARWSEKEGVARLQGEAAVRRTDFEVGTGDWKTDDTVGFDVRIFFDLQFRKKPSQAAVSRGAFPLSYAASRMPEPA